MKPLHRLWARCAAWAGFELGEEQIENLERYRDWLLAEAIPAGGLGPNEATRMDNRHIADSLLFAGGFGKIPQEVIDVGSGVGLPGVPLSIVMPQTRFILLDRSGRRAELLRRISRILDRGNVQVKQADIDTWKTPVDGIVSRASLSPERATTVFPRLLRPGGTAVIGGSWSSPPEVLGFDLLEVPVSVLDQRVWLLIMRPQ